MESGLIECYFSFAGCGGIEEVGYSNERMDLLERFEQIFPELKIAYISGEREFVGKEWLTYLLIELAISFRLRIKKSDRIGKEKNN